MCDMFQLRAPGKYVTRATMCVMFQSRVAGKWLRAAMTCVMSEYCDIFVLMLYYLFWVFDDVRKKSC